MRLFLVTISLFLSLIIPLSVSASGVDEGEERTKHYEVEKPTSLKQALKILNTKTDLIEQLASKRDLPQIHQQSYHLEAAMETLKERAPQHETSFKALSETIEVIHLASEEEQLTKITNALPVLRKQLNNLNKLLQ